MSTISMAFGKHALAVALNDGPAARMLAAALPMPVSMSRWGEGEYYGTLPVTLPAREKRRDVFEVGEVALWPDGNAFCVFFGPTPASRGSEPRMASPGIPLGRIVGGIDALAGSGPSLRVTLSSP